MPFYKDWVVGWVIISWRRFWGRLLETRMHPCVEGLQRRKRSPLQWPGRDVSGGLYGGEAGSCTSSLRRMRGGDACTRAGIRWGEISPASKISLKFHLLLGWVSWGIREIPSSLPQGEAGTAGIQSVPTALSKGSPGTASLWRRILEILLSLEVTRTKMGAR